jgi:hypothetical protein
MENPFENMKSVLFIILLFVGLNGIGQNYHAVNGSPFAGSLGIANNPSSMLNTPIKWDVTLIGVQMKAATNIFTIHNYSLLSSPAKSQYSINTGEFERKGKLSFNTNLFNTRITLDRKHAIGFGVNLRSYANIKSSTYNYSDSIKGARDFFNVNDPTQPYNASVTSSTWVEVFGSYARTILDDAVGRLNTGITVKASRGVAGAFFKAENLRYRKGTSSVNFLTQAGVSYGYSSNFDRWQKQKETNDNVQDLFTYSEGGIAVDLGVEYFIKTQAVRTYEDDDDYYDYKWKIGLSLLDAGMNQYKYGTQSRTAVGLREDMNDTLLDDKFRTINNLAEINDSLATITQSFKNLAGKFTVLNPMRLVVNADRFIGNDFYLNGEVSVNLASLFKKYHAVSELNFITITPRWETRRLGIYMPVQYNAAGKFWIGGAFKAGPLLLGVHNWGNVFGKKSMQNGGGYLALVIRAWTNNKERVDRRLNCPLPIAD